MRSGQPEGRPRGRVVSVLEGGQALPCASQADPRQGRSTACPRRPSQNLGAQVCGPLTGGRANTPVPEEVMRPLAPPHMGTFDRNSVVVSPLGHPLWGWGSQGCRRTSHTPGTTRAPRWRPKPIAPDAPLSQKAGRAAWTPRALPEEQDGGGGSGGRLTHHAWPPSHADNDLRPP
jgi:hypothetical protein